MPNDRSPPFHRFGAAWRPLAVAAALALAPAAHATDFIETADFSNSGATPTLLGQLTRGTNLITGVIDTYGAHVGPHGERVTQDMDFVTFVVPDGYRLTNFFVSTGTSIVTVNNTPADEAPRNDLLFLGLAVGNQVNYDMTFSSAAGLLGWTLVSQAQLGTDILSAIGAATYPGFPVPGATGFTGSLGPGTYSLWLYDGDERASYTFNLVATPVAEPATWAMMIAGFGAAGVAMRRRRRGGPVARYA